MEKIKIISSYKTIVAGFVLFNLIWWLASLSVNSELLPNPLSVYGSMFTAKGIMANTEASLVRIISGTIIAGVLGVILGVILSINKKINALVEPIVYFSYPIPKLALLPILMLFFGIGETTKIIMIVLIVVFQIIISIRDIANSIDKENIFVFKSLKASKLETITNLILPGILPGIFSALRVTVGITTSVLFVTETFGTDKGLGFFIVDSWMRLDYISMYGGIMMLSLMGFALFIVIDLLDLIFCSWNKVKSI